MMNRWRLQQVFGGVTALVLALGLILAPVSQAQAGEGKDHSPADKLAKVEMTDAHGNTHSMADFEGKFVVMEWINHQCPFVKKFYNAGKMQELQKKYTEKDVVWLSVCSSAKGKQGYLSPEQWQEVTKEKGAAPTAVIIDESGKIGRMLKAKTTPHMFIFNPKGEKIYQGAADSIVSVDPEDTKKAKNYVEMVLNAAMHGTTIPVHQTKPYGCSVKYSSKSKAKTKS